MREVKLTQSMMIFIKFGFFMQDPFVKFQCALVVEIWETTPGLHFITTQPTRSKFKRVRPLNVKGTGFYFSGCLRTSLSNLPGLKWVFFLAGTKISWFVRGLRALGFALVGLTSKTPKFLTSMRMFDSSPLIISRSTVNIPSTISSTWNIFWPNFSAVFLATSFFCVRNGHIAILSIYGLAQAFGGNGL